MIALYLPVLLLGLLLGVLSFHLLQFHSVLVDCLSFLIDLLLEGPCDLDHVLLVLLDALTSLAHVFLKVFKSECSLIEADIERRDITIAESYISAIPQFTY